jgi:glyoxylase-like metal-dependent hydrolase (beta-lactamase superfamily II)
MTLDPLSAGFSRITDLDAAWRTTGHGPRLRAVRTQAERIRDRFSDGPRVVAVRTLPLTTLGYPNKYAFYGAAVSPVPLLQLTHRAVLVQFMQQGSLKNLLFNPTDVDGARAAPFFARLIKQFGPRMSKLLQKKFEPLESQLAALEITPGDIDYVAFDHFHTQDLRSLLGTTDGTHKARFPNAKLIAPQVEWDDWDDLHPLQRAWFVRDGKLGVEQGQVLYTSYDIALGDGLMLLRSPGHTSGNQTLFMNTDHGVWGISENGTSADNWSPLDSKIAGLASTCRRLDLDVILNSNTPEGAADQYTSMIMERTLADRVSRAPAFVQMFPSSEVTPSVLAPGLSPTLLHRKITAGEIAKPTRRAAAA